MSESPHLAGADPFAYVFAGLGEMRGRFRSFDWSSSSLGPVEAWPQSLKSVVSTILGSAFPNIVLWGPDLTQLYNDGYREIMGAKHPTGLGMPTQECWPEAWGFNQPVYERAMAGETVYFEDVLIPIVRYGTLEDVYFTISYSPILDDRGTVGGVLVTLVETTSRVEAKKLLEERERLLADVRLERNRLGTLFQQSPSFLAVLRGPAHVFELANDAYFQLVGNRDLIGKPIVEALPEVTEQGFVALLDSVLETGTPFHGRETPAFISRDPESEPRRLFVNFVFQAITEADGSRSGVIVHGTDVTEQVVSRNDVQKYLEESELQRNTLEIARRQLALSESHLRDVFEQAPMAVAVLTGPDHVYSVASPAYTRYVGGRPLLGRAVREAVPEEVGSRVALLMDRVYQTGKPIEIREQVVAIDRDNDGVAEEYVFDISYHPLRDADGTVYAITSLSLDVTEQVRARTIIEQSTRVTQQAQQQLQRIFAQAPVAIAVLEGADQRLTLTNSAYEAIVGRPVVSGAPLREALPELEGQGIFELIENVYRGGEAFTADAMHVFLKRTENGSPEDAYFNVMYQPLHDESDAVYGVVALAVEVTEQVCARRDVDRLLRESEESRGDLTAANQQLEDQKVELELANQQLQDSATELEAQSEELHVQSREAAKANKAKSEFLATMSHELRTPLNAIAGYSDLLLEGLRGPLTDPQRLDITRLRRSGQHLLSLINDILNFAKLDAGRVEFRLQPASVRELVAGVSDLVGPQMAAKSIHLAIEQCDASVGVLVDPDKLRQILLNLMSNAVKFTAASGAVTISCDVGRESVTIHVRDTGRGIAADDIERVFDPFVQVDRQATSGSQQGVGLGLAISRDLARGMSGSLSATSEVGKGSTFSLTVPRAIAPAQR